MATYVKMENNQPGNDKDWIKLVREFDYDTNSGETASSQKALLKNKTVQCGFGPRDEGDQEESLVNSHITAGWQACNKKEWDELNCTEEDLEWNQYVK